MEINKEALDALSLSDLIALKNECLSRSKHLMRANKYDVIASTCIIEIDKRVENIFIF